MSTPDIRSTAWRLAEPGYRDWREARERIRQLKDAGYGAQATDMGESISIIVNGGTRGQAIEGVPPRSCYSK